MGSRTAPMVLAASCVLLVIAAAWLLLGRSRSSLPAPELDARAPTRPAEAAEAPSALAPTEGVTPGIERNDARPAGELAPGSGIDVQVVREDDGRPVPEADVYGFGSTELSDPRCRDELDEIGLGPEFFARNGRHARSDAQGLARIPTSPGTLQVIATDGTYFGMRTLARWSASDGPIRVPIRRGPGIDVLVRDALTRAPLADVAVVAVRAAVRDAPIGAHTGADGKARLWPLFEEAEAPGRWHAGVQGVFREPVRVAFTLAEAPPLLELSLPPSGAVQVRLVDPAGNLCPLAGMLAVGWHDSEGDPAEPLGVRITDGIARLARVEHGVTVHLRGTQLGISETPEAVFQLDAQRSGRERIDLVLQRPVPLLRARLLDEGGQPLRFVRVDCTSSLWIAGKNRIDTSDAVSRDDGATLFVLSDSDGTETLASFVFQAEVPGRAALGGVVHAAVRRGITELGDAQLGPALALFAGQVLDFQGGAVAGVEVELKIASGPGPSVIARALRATTDAQGRFEMLGWAEDGEFELEAFHEGHRASARARRGELAVELRLPDFPR